MKKYSKKKQTGGNENMTIEQLKDLLIESANLSLKNPLLHGNKISEDDVKSAVELLNEEVISKGDTGIDSRGIVKISDVDWIALKKNIVIDDHDKITRAVNALNKILTSQKQPNTSDKSIINSMNFSDFTQLQQDNDETFQTAYEKFIAKEDVIQFLLRNPIIFSTDLDPKNEQVSNILIQLIAMAKDFERTYINNEKNLKFLYEILKDFEEKNKNDEGNTIINTLDKVVELLREKNIDSLVKSEINTIDKPIGFGISSMRGGNVQADVVLWITSIIGYILAYCAGVIPMILILSVLGLANAISVPVSLIEAMKQSKLSKEHEKNEDIYLTQEHKNQLIKNMLYTPGYDRNYMDRTYRDIIGADEYEYHGPETAIELFAAESLFAEHRKDMINLVINTMETQLKQNYIKRKKELKLNDKQINNIINGGKKVAIMFLNTNQRHIPWVREGHEYNEMMWRNLTNAQFYNKLFHIDGICIRDMMWYSINKQEIKKWMSKNFEHIKEEAKNNDTIKLVNNNRTKFSNFFSILKRKVGKIRQAFKTSSGGAKVSLLGRTRRVIQYGDNKYVMIKGVRTTLSKAKLLHKQYEKEKSKAKGTRKR